MVLPKSTNIKKYITAGLMAGLSASFCALLSTGVPLFVTRESNFAAAALCLLVVAIVSFLEVHFDNCLLQRRDGPRILLYSVIYEIGGVNS